MHRSLFLFLLLALSGAINAADLETSSRKITLPVFQSHTLTLDRAAKRVSIADPEIADVVVLSPTEYYVLGRDVGVTLSLIHI